MPLDPLVSTLLSTIVSAVLEAASMPSVPERPFALVSVYRNFPSVAKPGRLLGKPLSGKVMISGKTLSVAPSLQIRDQSNRIILPGSLTGTNMPVLYQMDTTGANVWRVWILTPREISAMNFSAFEDVTTLPMPLY